MVDPPKVRGHPYQGLPDGKFCSYDYADLDPENPIDLCNMPRSEHEEAND